MQFFFRMGRVTGAVLLLIFLGSCSLFTIPSTPGKKGSVSGATNSKRGIAFNLSQKADLDELTAGAGGTDEAFFQLVFVETDVIGDGDHGIRPRLRTSAATSMAAFRGG